MGVPDPNQILNTNIYQQTLVSAFKDTVSESIGSGGLPELVYGVGGVDSFTGPCSLTCYGHENGGAWLALSQDLFSLERLQGRMLCWEHGPSYRPPFPVSLATGCG